MGADYEYNHTIVAGLRDQSMYMQRRAAGTQDPVFRRSALRTACARLWFAYMYPRLGDEEHRDRLHEQYVMAPSSEEHLVALAIARAYPDHWVRFKAAGRLEGIPAEVLESIP
jgi:hypothetical protein